MSSPVARIECRWCGTWVTLAKFRERHGMGGRNPHCISIRSYTWIKANEYTSAGRDHRVLELAGVVRYVPLYNFYWVEPPEWVAYIASQKSGRMEDALPMPDTRRYQMEAVADYTAVAPRWAVGLARRLMDDQVLAKALGNASVQKRVSEYRTHRANRSYNPAVAHDHRSISHPRKLVLPLAYRAAVIRSCAASAMTREMIEDDPLAALTIMRDVG